METWKNIRCNTFKTAPWVNSQHEEFKTSTHLGRPSWRCVASLQNKRRIFFHPKKVADWISWSTVNWISWSFYLEKILMINESTLGCWVPQPPLRMQSVNRWRGGIPNELSNLPFLGDAQTHFVMVIAVWCPTWTEGRVGGRATQCSMMWWYKFWYHLLLTVTAQGLAHVITRHVKQVKFAMHK